jgi:hypothetical protein
MKRLSTILFLLLIAFASCNSSESNKSDDESKHTDLQVIENKVIQFISEGKSKDALDLLNDMVHPSSKSSYDYTSRFVSFSQYWQEKREELREKILSGKYSDEANMMESSENDSTLINEVFDINSFPPDLIGLYVSSNDDGVTKLFKLVKSSDSDINIVFQDNAGGKVVVENYSIQSFEQERNILELINKKDASLLMSITFIRDKESENGFCILDGNGEKFSFVSK